MSAPLLTLYGPLWGARFDSDAAGAISDSVMACVPHAEEWATIERSDVHRTAIQAHGGWLPPPPLCVVGFARCGDGEDIDSAIARDGARLHAALVDAVTALRLAAPGWFLDPGLSSLTYAIAGNVWQLRRQPGAYRQAAVAGVGLPLPPYALSIDALTTAVGEGPVWRMATRVAAFRRDSGNAAADIAISQFNRSFGYAMAPADRAAPLFTAIDAMMGGMSARRIGRVELKPRFRRRVALALEAGGLASETAASEAAWFDWQEGGRGLRNALAHGDTDAGGIGTDDVLRLQAIVRALLPGFLDFAIGWSGDPGASLTAAFNVRPKAA